MLFAAVAPVFVILGLGFLLRRLRVLNEEADASLLRICVNLLYPCLIATTIIGNDLLDDFSNVWLPPLTGILFVAIGYLVAFGGARALGLETGRGARTFVFVTGLYNYGYTAIPVVENLFGTKTLGILFTHNLGVEIAFWVGAGLILANRGGGGDRQPLWRHLLSTPVIAILVSLLLHFLSADDYLPAWLLVAAGMIGASAIPMALLLTGATLSDFAAEVRPTRSGAVVTASATAIRLAVLPILFILIARWLPCSRELKEVLIVQAAMPCAMLPIVLAKHYGGDTGMAIQIVLVTTALGLFTIPYWVSLGLRVAGL
ncbi:MAG TPA: AEC family transporter [Chthoniobacteraceae bacterium]|nr:AEC family transporter [Chthoniobacteraceae bacterium]